MLKLTTIAIAAAAALVTAPAAMAQVTVTPTTIDAILGQTYGPGAVQAQPATGGPDFSQGELIQVSGGCGPNGWRGPGGACHWNRGPGWGPRGYYWRGRYWTGNGCPPGYWRGPWGHCRNTPYHGPLPGGGWKN